MSRHIVPQEVQPDPVESAHAAGLRYVNVDSPGIARKRHGKSFTYEDPSGHRVTDRPTLDRIQSLVIPPAWEDVWICPFANGHIQAIGRDARGRKQYRYHPHWRDVRDSAKYDRMIAFAEALPRIRERVQSDLALPGLPREKVLAAIVRLLETTSIRIGNDEYAKQNKSYGLTTLRNRHVAVRGSKIHFEFRGKSGVDHEIDLEDPRLARIIRACQELPEQDLFEYLSEAGEPHSVTSTDVNAYLQEISGADFTAKDFRTWAGTLLATLALRKFEPFTSATQAKKNIVAAIEHVAEKLGNTRTVCRKCYVHPAVLEGYAQGALMELRIKSARRSRKNQSALSSEESAVLRLLRTKLTEAVRKSA